MLQSTQFVFLDMIGNPSEYVGITFVMFSIYKFDTKSTWSSISPNPGSVFISYAMMFHVPKVLIKMHSSYAVNSLSNHQQDAKSFFLKSSTFAQKQDKTKFW